MKYLSEDGTVFENEPVRSEDEEHNWYIDKLEAMKNSCDLLLSYLRGERDEDGLVEMAVEAIDYDLGCLGKYLEKRNKYYFTFGLNPNLPYQDSNLIVIAGYKAEAVNKFREKYPDRIDGYLNCSFVLTAEQWKRSSYPQYFSNRPFTARVEIIK